MGHGPLQPSAVEGFVLPPPVGGDTNAVVKRVKNPCNGAGLTGDTSPVDLEGDWRGDAVPREHKLPAVALGLSLPHYFEEAGVGDVDDLHKKCSFYAVGDSDV